MQTAIATVCLSGTLNEKLEAMAAARFKGVELFENDLLSFDGTPAQVGRRIKDLGLEAVTFQPFRRPSLLCQGTGGATRGKLPRKLGLIFMTETSRYEGLFHG